MSQTTAPGSSSPGNPAPAPPDASGVVAKLSMLDRFLPVWIIAAMAVGLALGAVAPGFGEALESFKVAGVSLPIALGLLIMMYPVLAKVRYDETAKVIGDRKLIITSLLINWLLAPAFMFVLAWVFLPDLPEYRTGLIIVGLARCIAMVLIWNDLACGDREAAAVLVAINSVFQVVMFGVLGWFYLQLLPSWLGLPTTSAEFSIAAITVSVLVFLGIPLVAGYLTRTLGERTRGRNWYEGTVLPRLGPWALYGLLFTIVVLFALQGEQVLAQPMDVVRIALPLTVYFLVVFAASMLIGWILRLGYERSTTLSFTAAGNNFELAIAVSIATFGATSGQALAGIVGPLIEVPILVALVYVALWARRWFTTSTPSALVAADATATTTATTTATITPATAEASERTR
ncbi:ACR3 family arsenite transporter [Nesterenkonia xinjiangensis]|uniref:ACR3 family arsenite transporter n=2 Tax=Nesterenkonia xinjiangensis TaxID=225327 RepID=A0A7Z0K9X2_9MICC|nr:ACR3 family arsenite transporter [Nesterenkonia xinjiangensis]